MARACKINRVLTQPLQRRLDPFLMLDAFGSDKPGDYIAGFPEHPHRGFETVTYMLAGRMRHRDSAGNEGLVTNGGVQWMTAGRGVVHSEMPEQNEGLMEGFQLWLNLPAQGQDVRALVPRHPGRGRAALHAAARGADRAGDRRQQPRRRRRRAARRHRSRCTSTSHLPAGADVRTAAAGRAQRLLLRVSAAKWWSKARPCRRRAWRSSTMPQGADGVRIKASADSRLILIAGRPLSEPIAQYGPFVMNTQAELIQAVEDFRSGPLLIAANRSRRTGSLQGLPAASFLPFGYTSGRFPRVASATLAACRSCTLCPTCSRRASRALGFETIDAFPPGHRYAATRWDQAYFDIASDTQPGAHRARHLPRPSPTRPACSPASSIRRRACSAPCWP